MSKEETIPGVTKATRRNAKAARSSAKAAPKAAAKKAAKSTARKAAPKKKSPSGGAVLPQGIVAHPSGSGKTLSHAHIVKALKALVEGPLGTEIEGIADVDRAIDLILAPKGASVSMVEANSGAAGVRSATRKISPWPIENIAVELVPHGEGKDFHYELIRHDLGDTRSSTSELADQMLPDAAIPTPSQVLLARGEARQRWNLLQEFGALTGDEIADHRSRAKNRHAIASRWRNDGKIFSVSARGRRLYPGFQFDPETFAPEPVVAQVLAALPREEMSEWEVALWWVAADPHLGGRRPIDLMHSDPEALAGAAAALSGPIAF